MSTQASWGTFARDPLSLRKCMEAADLDRQGVPIVVKQGSVFLPVDEHKLKMGMENISGPHPSTRTVLHVAMRWSSKGDGKASLTFFAPFFKSLGAVEAGIH